MRPALQGARQKSENSRRGQQAALPESQEQPAPLAAERAQQASVQRAEQRWSPQALPLSEPPEQLARPVPLDALALPQQARAPSRARPETACPKIPQPLR